MEQQKRRDTTPEVALRSALHSLGLRFRVEAAIVPGSRRRVDVVFPGPKVAVFVDGCFWHGCPLHATMPKTNTDWWRDKLDANVARDRDTDARLGASGWEVMRVWEHENPADAAGRIHAVVRRRSQGWRVRNT